MNRIESVGIRGFRSLADVRLENLPNAAVLIGANGSGKSNLIRFFEMCSWMCKSRQLGEFVQRHGGASDQLFGGAARTPKMSAELRMRTERGRNDYRFELAHAHPDRLIFTEEALRFSSDERGGEANWQHCEVGHREAMLVEAAQGTIPGVHGTTASVVLHLLRSCATFQFHDTSDSAGIKRWWDVEDSSQMRSHGGNLAAILYRLERSDIRRFDYICDQINRILPIFDRFQIAESHGKAMLRWTARGFGESFGAHLTSDGSLRLFALVTLLNLPPDMLPDVLLLDEPELGLHPAAATLVGAMIRSLAEERQVIVATQSPLLVDSFDLDEVIVLEAQDGRTQCRRLQADDYRIWLEEDGFGPGELWQRNLIGGRP